MVAQAQEGDVLVFHFSGHGTQVTCVLSCRCLYRIHNHSAVNAFAITGHACDDHWHLCVVRNE